MQIINETYLREVFERFGDVIDVIIKRYNSKKVHLIVVEIIAIVYHIISRLDHKADMALFISRIFNHLRMQFKKSIKRLLITFNILVN